MRWTGLLIVLGAAATLAACTSDNREWMKLNQKYTTEDFRRDLKSCTDKKDKIDDECMRRLGWVPVSPGRDQKAPEPYAPAQMGIGRGR